MSERLEEIKSRVWKEKCTYAKGDDESREGYSYTLSDYDFEWFIKQAERAETLERLREEDSTYYNELLTKLREQNKRYKQALEYYANQCHMNYSIDTGEWDGDDGGIARQALGWEEGK